MGAFLGILLAFQIPVYHLVFQKDSHTLIAIEDLTLPECQARKKTFKKTAHAQCVLEIGERELT